MGNYYVDKIGYLEYNPNRSDIHKCGDELTKKGARGITTYE